MLPRMEVRRLKQNSGKSRGGAVWVGCIIGTRMQLTTVLAICILPMRKACWLASLALVMNPVPATILFLDSFVIKVLLNHASKIREHAVALA